MCPNKTRTTSQQPQAHGLLKRYVKTIEERLKKVVSTHRPDWEVRLPMFQLAYRNINP
jgi:hypothetical protein